jgi:hypothetical protein
MRLRKREMIALVVALPAIVVAGIYGYTVEPILQFAGTVLWLLSGLLVLAGIVNVLADWSPDRWRALLMLGITLGGFVLSVVALRAGTDLRDRAFLRQMAPYERFANAYQAGAVRPGRFPVDSLPPALKHCCYVVQGNRDSTGVWQVEFVWGWGFPMHHTAWVYSSGTSRTDVMRRGRWYSASDLVPHWYRVSD